MPAAAWLQEFLGRGGQHHATAAVATFRTHVHDPVGLGDDVEVVLDEPTVGLHMADVEKLIRVLHRLVDAGNSVVLIEHNLDVIAEADWIVDMGPEGGDAGGRVVMAAPPEEFLRASAKTHTARALREFMATHSR